MAGAVGVTSVGHIYTQGASSIGIQAQSIGGGGGNGGWSGALALSQGVALGVSIGGGGGSGNSAGAVTVDSTGNIVTGGANAIGIQAQSIGGAGGNGGFSLSLAGSLKGTSVGVSSGGAGAAAARRPM